MSCLPKCHAPFALASAIFFCVALSGCTTALTHSTPTSWSKSVAPPESAPKIILGQKAYVNGYEQDIEVWRETGLFSSVEATSSYVPPIKGVFISRNCTYYKRSNGFLGGLLNAMFVTFSLGLLPDLTFYEEGCEMEFYQNGKKIAVANVSYNERYEKGWLVSSSETAKWKKEESRMCANRLLRSI